MLYIVMNKADGWIEICKNLKSFNALVKQQLDSDPHSNPKEWKVYKASELKRVKVEKVYKFKED